MRRVFSASLLALMHDMLMAAASFAIALYLRLSDVSTILSAPYFLPGLALFILIAGITFTSMRLYRGMWHFASVEDLSAIAKAVSLTILIFAFLMFGLSRLEGFPRSALFINWLLLIFMLGAPRFAIRLLKDGNLKRALKRDEQAIPIILYGAGRNSELFVRDCLRNHESLYRVMAILDPAPQHRHRTLHGVKIYQTDLPFLLRKLKRRRIDVQRLVIAEDISSEQLMALTEASDASGLSLSRLPRIDTLQKHDAASSAKQPLKPIDIEDLLGRPQRGRDTQLMSGFAKGSCILITGAGGSIGSELCRQLAALEPSALLLLDHSEFALYRIDQQLRHQFPSLTITPILMDIRDNQAVMAMMQQHQPHSIFHAAAIKHVPLSEQNPIAAIHTNVLGTQNMLKAADASAVKHVVLISTDKAVSPTNVMGASKRLAEKLFFAPDDAPSPANKPAQRIAVRFGNVLGSAGSVVPLFQEQLAAGGPITITHPDISRYFMTIREAVDLVIHAASLAAGSDATKSMYVLDMGKPMLIKDLAAQMIRLSGLKPDEDIAIRYTGLRPGEKLYEELFYPEEAPSPTQLEQITQSNALPSAPDRLHSSLAALADACQSYQHHEALTLLKTLVPEYQLEHQRVQAK